jgi:Icc-related predicted phosphoesterase
VKSLTCLVVLLAGVASAEDFEGFEDRFQFDCNAPFEHFSPPEVKSLPPFTLEHTGATLKLRRDKPRKKVVLGVLAGIKDLEPETKTLLDQFITRFEKDDVDAIVIGGDSSSEPDGLDAILGWLVARTKRPLLVIGGNMERGAALNYAILKQRKAGATHLLNLGMIHRVDFDGLDVVSVSGYHDRAFLHLTGGCIYKDKDLTAAEEAVKAADDPVLLLTHGPPRMKGQQALDYVPGADNVGDPRLTELIKSAKIPFGISGHILEAAGKATDLTGHPLPQKKPLPSLYLDQGSANPLPWKMNDGTTSYGLGAVLTVEGKKASYEILRGEKPKPQ